MPVPSGGEAEQLGLPIVGTADNLLAWRTGRPPGRLTLDFDRPRDAAVPAHYPCILKPRSLAGSRGVIRVDDPAEFVAFVRRTGRILRVEAPENPQETHTRLLGEGYPPSSEHTLEGLISNARLEPLALFDKPDPPVGPFFEKRLYLTPSRFEPALSMQFTPPWPCLCPLWD